MFWCPVEVSKAIFPIFVDRQGWGCVEDAYAILLEKDKVAAVSLCVAAAFSVLIVLENFHHK